MPLERTSSLDSFQVTHSCPPVPVSTLQSPPPVTLLELSLAHSSLRLLSDIPGRKNAGPALSVTPHFPFCTRPVPFPCAATKPYSRMQLENLRGSLPFFFCPANSGGYSTSIHHRFKHSFSSLLFPATSFSLPVSICMGLNFG